MVYYYRGKLKGKSLINKVKPPIPLKLVQSSQQAKNDLGGQSGEAYSQNPAPSAPAEEPAAPSELPGDPEAVAAAGSLPNPDTIGDQVGLTQVVKEWLEEGKTAHGISRRKMSARYQGESAPAKGMLLNKKIS